MFLTDFRKTAVETGMVPPLSNNGSISLFLIYNSKILSYLFDSHDSFVIYFFEFDRLPFQSQQARRNKACQEVGRSGREKKA